MPNATISKLNGNFSTNYDFSLGLCRKLEYLYSLWPVDRTTNYYCLGQKSFQFHLLSRPWLCEIQVDLFMPDSLFRLGKHTEIFDKISYRHFLDSPMPSLRQPVTILVDTKASADEYDWVSLAAWTIKRHFGDTNDPIDNNVQITGHVHCKISKRQKYFECNIKNFNIIYPCPKCPKFANVYSVNLEHLSFVYIDALEYVQKFVGFPVIVQTPGDLLEERIGEFLSNRPEFIAHPLNKLRKFSVKSSDKLQTVSFGFASIFLSLMGNTSKPLTVKHQNEEDFYYFTRYLQRRVDIRYGTKLNILMQVRNSLGGLHFVSCGSRGIEPFPFDQLISVFEWKVWVFIIVSMTLLIITIVLLHKKGSRFIGMQMGTLSMWQVLMEQGNPFPQFFDKDAKMRFLMSGTLFAALVITNSFKSENVYNIVLPRKQVSYYNYDELIEDNVTIFTRYSRVSYFFTPSHRCILPSDSDDEICRHLSFTILCSSDFHGEDGFIRDFDKLYTNTQIHPMARKVLTDSIKMLDELVKVGILNKYNSGKLQYSQHLKDQLKNTQDELISKSLNNCNKTAWVLPDYIAQTLHRSLKKVENILTLAVELIQILQLRLLIWTHMYHLQYLEDFHGCVPTVY